VLSAEIKASKTRTECSCMMCVCVCVCVLVHVCVILWYFTHVSFVQESDTPVDWDLTSGSTFMNYIYPPLPHVKFQLLCVRLIGQLIVHGTVCVC